MGKFYEDSHGLDLKLHIAITLVLDPENALAVVNCSARKNSIHVAHDSTILWFQTLVIFHVKMKLTMEMNSHMGFVNIEAAVQKIVL